MPNCRIEVLTRAHRPLLKGFQNQEPSLVTYLKRYALRHTEKDMLSRSYLAITEQHGMERVAGYFSLSTASVTRSTTNEVPGLDRLPRFPIPAILLARLAVDVRVQGQGLGRYLFDEALGLTLELVTSGPVAFRLFVTDAISEDAVRFYTRLGFVRSAESLPARMVLDLKGLMDSIEE